jgi:superfamily II DNA or RNA helicase
VKIIERLTPEVPEVVRNGGRNAFERGELELRRLSRNSLLGVFDGVPKREARLRNLGPYLLHDCNCPEAREGVCRHVWATLLAAEAGAFPLDGLPLSGELHLERDPTGRTRPLEASYESPGSGHNDDDEAPGLAEVLQHIGTLSRRKPRGHRSHRTWREILEELRNVDPGDVDPGDAAEPTQEWRYVLDLEGTQHAEAPVIELFVCRQRKTGGWGEPRPRNPQLVDLADVETAIDRQIIALLGRGEDENLGWLSFRRSSYLSDSDNESCLQPECFSTVVPLLSQTGRFYYRSLHDGDEHPLAVDGGGPWELRLRLDPEPDGKAWFLKACLRRGSESIDLAEALAVVEPGWLVREGCIAALSSAGDVPWVALLGSEEPVRIRKRDLEPFLTELSRLATLPALELPPELGIVEESPALCPIAVVEPCERDPRRHKHLAVKLRFDYGGITFEGLARSSRRLDFERRKVIVRDPASEAAALERLHALGAKLPAPRLLREGAFGPNELDLKPSLLAPMVRALTAEGWRVEASGKLYRRPGDFSLKVSSGIDWFELHAELDFGGQQVGVPQLLAAARKGDGFVALDDGSFGVLPEEWLRRYGLLLSAAEPEGASLRFRTSQAALLDVFLAEQEGSVQVDEVFRNARQALRAFQGIEAVEPGPGFAGELRPYQREGLGWLQFLTRFGMGGCLADDMGLGKTVQVLALLDLRREDQGRGEGKHRPALVVVPRSLVFNWMAESNRFTPALRVLDHTGASRVKSEEHLAAHHVVLTTYGTLRRDIAYLKDIEFDHVILDESQAIKNAASDTAKAARLLKGRHRLALSGTPVENHLSDLWSLFEYLNPGVLGATRFVKELGSDEDGAAAASLSLLAKALRPLILRRTKSEVAKDLPERLEQTIFCDLEPTHRDLYTELRDHYRASLQGLVESQGLGRAKIQVLEALLRLRQAACHPGLVNPDFKDESSSKQSLLLERLKELRAEGHKALVFSQFVKFLTLVRRNLDAEGVPYEYLDGQTRDRAARVDRFQNDPDCRLFLVSLKAGGQGLNLTAAEYVFLLDPWWNPAVEAQAIDRAHRIGQTRRVFAYRLIAKDTVEEKVLELQARKRQLVEEILSAQRSVLSDLTREDLAMLLG